jgi:hypothetical protein
MALTNSGIKEESEVLALPCLYTYSYIGTAIAKAAETRLEHFNNDKIAKQKQKDKYRIRARDAPLRVTRHRTTCSPLQT